MIRGPNIRAITESRGSMLINLIVGMVIVAILGAGMFYMTTTTTYAELFANREARTYYLAEAGGYYALKGLSENTTNPNYYPGGNKYGEPPAATSTTYTLQNGDRFILTSYDFKKDGVVDKTRVVIECIGVVHAGTWLESKRKITFYGKEGLVRATASIERSTDTADMIDYIEENNVFVYGSAMAFSGDSVTGDGATIVIKGKEGQAYALTTNQVNGGAAIAATTIYIGGNVKLDGGSASLGSSAAPGKIYINGSLELWNGARHIYGDVYVNGNFRLKDARIHGDIYVNGNVTLDWTPWLSATSHIYYKGTLAKPNYYDQSILNKFHHIPYNGVDGNVATFPSFTMPDYAIPAPRESAWFTAHGYVSSGTLVSNLKIYTEGNYVSAVWRPTAKNVIIVSKGDISITRLGGSGLTGVLYAPYGKVTFEGGYFTGVVIARDGFFVTSGGTDVTFDQSYLDILGADGFPFLPDTTPSQY